MRLVGLCADIDRRGDVVVARLTGLCDAFVELRHPVPVLPVGQTFDLLADSFELVALKPVRVHLAHIAEHRLRAVALDPDDCEMRH